MNNDEGMKKITTLTKQFEKDLKSVKNEILNTEKNNTKNSKSVEMAIINFSNHVDELTANTNKIVTTQKDTLSKENNDFANRLITLLKQQQTDLHKKLETQDDKLNSKLDKQNADMGEKLDLHVAEIHRNHRDLANETRATHESIIELINRLLAQQQMHFEALSAELRIFRDDTKENFMENFARHDAIDLALSRQEARLQLIEERLAEFNNKLDNLDSNDKNIQSEIAQNTAKFTEAKISNIDRDAKIEKLDGFMSRLTQKVREKSDKNDKEGQK